MNRIIDVHHHWIPPHQAKHLERVALPGQSVRELRPGTMGLFRGKSMLFWCNEQISSVDRLMANLDRCSIEKAVLSVSNWIEWLDLAMCREVNDAMYELKRKFPDRIMTLAHVPIGEEGAIDELERCRSMGVDGVFTVVHLSRKGWSLDHPGLNTFYRWVDEARLPIVVHPACEPLEYVATTPKERLPLSDHDLLTCYGRPYNTTVSLLRLLLSELTDRYPRLRFIYPHLGGSFGVMKERILSRYYDLGMREVLEKRLSHFWFDTAPPRWSSAEYRCAIEQLGTSRVLFGSDHPIADDYLDRAVALLAGFSEEERTQIGRLNAEAFFGA
ncbi:MAG TPA: amidohydrolase family protein [Burkholderiales bacterium]|nr:amidohydrolase family protein [Burkholderiales bacterium]